MSTRTYRILRAALATNTNTSSHSAADVRLSELQPHTSYEFVISDKGILQHEILTPQKPVLVNCFKEFSQSQDLVFVNSVPLVSPVKLTAIEGIPPSDELVNFDPGKSIYFHEEITVENPLNCDLLEILEPEKSVHFGNELIKEIPPNNGLFDGLESEKSTNFINETSEEIRSNHELMERLGPDNETVLDNYTNEKSGGNDKRRKIADQNEWDRNKNKKLRMSGEQYIGYTRSKTGDIKHDIKRPARKVGTPCMCSSNHKCKQFSEIERQAIFNRFWTLTWEQKKMYVRSLAQYTEKKRSYTQSASRRTGTIIYSLQLDANKLAVCKRMFMSTLGIGEKMIRNWLIEPMQHGMPLPKNQRNKTKNKPMMLREFNLQEKSLTVFHNSHRIIAENIRINFTFKNVFVIQPRSIMFTRRNALKVMNSRCQYFRSVKF